MSKIKERRIALHLTQEQLSEKARISREHLSNIENQKFEPNLKTLKKLAKALGCEAKDLM